MGPRVPLTVENGQVKAYTSITDLSLENFDTTHAFINDIITYSDKAMEPEFYAISLAHYVRQWQRSDTSGYPN